MDNAFKNLENLNEKYEYYKIKPSKASRQRLRKAFSQLANDVVNIRKFLLEEDKTPKNYE